MLAVWSAASAAVTTTVVADASATPTNTSAPVVVVGASSTATPTSVPTAGGAFIVDRINKFPLVLSFGGVSFGLLLALGRIDPTTAAELLRTPFVQATCANGSANITSLACP